MTVGASNVNCVTALSCACVARARSSGPKASGSSSASASRARRVVDQHVRPAVLEQHLAAPAARHQQVARAVHARQRDQPSAAAGMQGADHCALGTET